MNYLLHYASLCIVDAHESRPSIDSNIAGSKTKAPSSG